MVPAAGTVDWMYTAGTLAAGGAKEFAGTRPGI
jgi:hypothetical protein